MHLRTGKKILQCSHSYRISGLGCVRAKASGSGAAPVRAAQQTDMDSQPAISTKKLEEVNFDNLTLRALPIDPVKGGPVRQVEGACFSRVDPTPVSNPKLVVASPDALSLLDIDPSEICRPDFAAYFSGNKLLPGSSPAAHCYCGHQFGYFSGQLGDGATMYLGEVVNGRGERWELQFKGAGKTPYSRQADGRKVLRSSLREFLCSEAMFYLGIPTTRAGTCVTSDTKVVRDIFYNGNAILERATIITRIAPTFLRFGSFEIFKPTDNYTGRRGPSAGLESALLPSLLHHVIRTYFPAIWAAHEGDVITAGVGVAPDGSGNPWPPQGGKEQEAALQAMYLEWLTEVTRRTASLVAAWQCVGWCHGVLNTDNMSVVGVTIDYGPFGFLDRYDPDFICNGSDDSGRYDYKSQPDMCRWNCDKLAEAVRGVLPEGRGKRAVADTYLPQYRRTYLALMRRKLGLIATHRLTEGAGAGGLEEGEAGEGFGDPGLAAADEGLVRELLEVMAETGADFTNVFRCLSRFPAPAPGTDPTSPGAVQAGGVLDYILTQCTDAATLAAASAPHIPPENLNMLSMLAGKNPELLHQMGLSQQMLATEMARMRRSEQLAKVAPEAKKAADRDRWSSWLGSYGQRLQDDVVAGASEAKRVAIMNSTNPRFILRNWIAQQAIEKAEKGDFSEVARVVTLLRNPFSDADVSSLLSSFAGPLTATGRGGGVTDETAAASSSHTFPLTAAAAATAAPAGPGAADGAGASGSGAAAKTGLSCALPLYDGRPPEWADKLCVT